MDIIYLDQNKWVELARVHAGADNSGPIAELYPQLIAAVEAGRVLFPLSSSHILETSKRNDPVSRGNVAETQAKLSRGYAYRDRTTRLEVEVRTTLLRLFDEEPTQLPPNWAIGAGFWQVFGAPDTLENGAQEIQALIQLSALIDPAELYVSYMKDQDDAVRRVTHAKVAADTAELIARVEERRSRVAGAPLDLRRRAYAVEQFMENQDHFLRVLGQLGYTFDQLHALGERAIKALIEDVPTLNVEGEMAARPEARSGSIKPNDAFDMQWLYTAIPYSSHVVAEKSAIALARQARLDVRYSVRLFTSLTDLLGRYQ